MKALVNLGRAVIPRDITAKIPAYLASIRNIHAREVWTIHKEWRGASLMWDGHFLGVNEISYLEEKLRSLGITEWGNDPQLLVFRNVGLHNDDENYINRRAAGFFHLVLRGKGTLKLPGAKDPAMRQLRMEKGTMFFMNPRARHMVVDASEGPIISLTMTVLPPPSCI